MVLAGFEVPTEGRLTLDGREVTAIPAEDRAFGVVFQGCALFPHMMVEDNIAFPLRVHRRPANEIRKRVAKIVEMVGPGGHGHKKPSGLSGGQQQRVALARALVQEPTVLQLDEPFSALDKNLRCQMQNEVRRLHRDTGTTFVFVTHDQSEALALSSRIAVFDHGKLQQLATPKGVSERPANCFAAGFPGEINILPLSDIRSDGAGAPGRFEGPALRAFGKVTDTLAVRAEYMALHGARPADGNAVAARVRDLTYPGAETQLSLPTANLPDGLAARPRVLSVAGGTPPDTEAEDETIDVRETTMNEPFQQDRLGRLADRARSGEISRRRFAQIAVALLGTSALAARGTPVLAQSGELVVVNWGSDAVTAYDKAYGQTVEAETGVKVLHDGSGPTEGATKAQFESGKPASDLVDADPFSAKTLGKKGMMEPIDYNVVDKSRMREGFGWEYAASSCFLSYSIAYDATKFGDAPPTGMADFFDVEKFPGKRDVQMGRQDVGGAAAGRRRGARCALSA